MEKYIPDVYQKSIYTIDYQKLKSSGIHCLLFDLDNTLVPASVKVPNKKIKDFFEELKQQGFQLIVFSNSPKKRVKAFADQLAVGYVSSAMKPFKGKFQRVMKQYHYEESEVAMIGDQMLTDVLGGNSVGITTILVNPVSRHDMIFTRLNRFLEDQIIRKLREKDLFMKGKYYD